MRLETLAVRTRHTVDATSGAVAPAIHLSTTFERATDGSFPHGYIYTRGGNPNRDALEAGIAALEGGAVAAACPADGDMLRAIQPSIARAELSGVDAACPTQWLRRGHRRAAGPAPRRPCRRARRRVSRHATYPAQHLCALERRGNLRRRDRPNAGRRGHQIEYTPFLGRNTSNPRLKITDIARIAKLARESGARCVCDNTWATPVLQRPFEFGADLIVHSTTKYLGGHSDVLGGAVVTQVEDDFWAQVQAFQKDGGAVPSPFECWLVLRSIPTLPYRMRAHAENAHKIALFLKEHPRITSVHYPGLQDSPGYAVASRQMSGFGGMLSFEVAGGQRAAMAVAAKVKLFTRATSLGGVESLIEHRASIEGPASPTPSNLLRLSVGLEHADDLLEDLAQALA